MITIEKKHEIKVRKYLPRSKYSSLSKQLSYVKRYLISDAVDDVWVICLDLSFEAFRLGNVNQLRCWHDRFCVHDY